MFLIAMVAFFGSLLAFAALVQRRQNRLESPDSDVCGDVSNDFFSMSRLPEGGKMGLSSVKRPPGD